MRRRSACDELVDQQVAEPALVGGLEALRSAALGSRKDRSLALILIRGEPLGHPDRLQVHFDVLGIDAHYARLKEQGVAFSAPSQDKPWGWRHAYTTDPAGHTVEICTPIAGCPQ